MACEDGRFSKEEKHDGAAQSAEHAGASAVTCHEDADDT